MHLAWGLVSAALAALLFFQQRQQRTVVERALIERQALRQRLEALELAHALCRQDLLALSSEDRYQTRTECLITGRDIPRVRDRPIDYQEQDPLPVLHAEKKARYFEDVAAASLMKSENERAELNMFEGLLATVEGDRAITSFEKHAQTPLIDCRAPTEKWPLYPASLHFLHIGGGGNRVRQSLGHHKL